MQLNVLQLKRSLYITFMLYSSKIWWDFSFHQKTKFLFNSKQFSFPPNRIDICYVYQKGIWVRQNKLFWQTSKETMGGVRRGFFMVRIYWYALFCRVKKGGTKYYGLSLFAQKLLRFILFYLKNARANNVLV